MKTNNVFSCISPCKVNDFLYIVGKTTNGYHKLQTLFTVLKYGDTMTFESAQNDGLIEIQGPFDFPQEQNLIYKAAALLKRKYAINKGIKISVIKRLPEGGGLGGGSGNAATTLLVLNRIWDLNLSEAELISMGNDLGADVPLFIKGTTTFGQGTGEILQEVKLPTRWYLVVNPGCKVPTKELFALPELKRDSPVRTLEQLLKIPFENSFTPCVIKRYPQVQKLLDELSAYGNVACMSGSGSSCFVRFSSKKKCTDAFNDFLSRHDEFKVFMAPSCNENPVVSDLNKFLLHQTVLH
ncbi:MAG TPA: 4-(cytidine 5'-diphospho)-2-C-methyl-D-erythritol kinase [Succinivibrionaceae bacterium]|nr:4-(cytidine 5'-diphospho)-2-C-methyl-D-erythritol kinase [Succinivibrionaceae bacterium]